MRIRLRHVKPVKKRLASGEIVTYYYHRVTGKRIHGAPGTQAFLVSYEAASKIERCADPETIAGLILDFQASPKFGALRPRTQADYRRLLDAIKAKFGACETEVFNDPRIRRDIMEWRDGIGKRSCKQADYALAVLRALLQWGYDQGRVAVNHAAHGGKLYTPDRSDKIWNEGDIEAFLRAADETMRQAFLLALGTGQRQGDLLALVWSAYDGEALRFKQSKGRRNVYVPCTAALRSMLNRMREERRAREMAGKAIAATVLTNRSGQPWTANGFRTMFGRTKRKAGIVGLTFHDLRGTFVTRAAERGCTPQEIATITGHSIKDVERILDAYMARTPKLAWSAIRKYETGNETGTKSGNQGGN